MKINIPSRDNVPSCEIYVDIMQQATTGTNHLGYNWPVMLMLPGGPGGNHTVYDSIKESLFKYADLVLIDPRGCGLSSSSDVKFCTMEESVNDIEAIRNLLGIEKFILFGGSYGAMVSLSYAVSYSHYLKGLILVAGAATGECFNTALQTLRRIGTEEQIALTEKLFAGKIESVAEKEKYYSLMRNIYLAKSQDQHEDTNKDIPTLGKRLPYFLELSNFGHSEILPNYNIVNNLYKITAPTLLLAGELDWINNVMYAYQMEKLINDAELVVFPNAGHFVWNGIEGEFYSKIEAFISKLF